MAMPTGNGENPDSERLETPKTDCVLKVNQVGLQVC